MIIRKLSGRNIKGQTFSHDLCPVTLFHGANFSGKTTRLEALMLALAGYIPAVGSKDRDIWDRLASASQMSVEIDLSSGAKIGRTWADVQGKVKYSGGEGSLVPKVVIDANEFLGISGPSQVRFLFERAILPPELSVENLAKSIKDGVTNVLNLQHGIDAHVLRSTIGFSKYLDEAVAGNLVPVQEWLQAVVVGVNERKKAAVASEQRLQKTAQGLTQIASGRQSAPVDAEARLAKATEDYDKAVRELSNITSAVETARDDYRKAKELADEVKDVEESAALNAELITLTAREIQIPPDVDRETWCKLSDAAGDLQELITPVEKTMLDLSAKADFFKERLMEMSGKASPCPTCGHKISAAERSKEKAKAKKEHAEILAKRSAVAKDFTRMSGELKQLRDALFKMDSARLARRKVIEADTERQNKMAGISAKLAKVGPGQKAKEQLPEIALLGKRLAAQMEECQKRVDDLLTAKQKADQDFRLLLADRAGEKQRADAKTYRLQTSADAVVYKVAEKVLNEKQAELVTAAINPILKIANSVAPNLMPFLIYQDEEIRFMGKRYGWRSMSGTEKTLLRAKLSVALAQDSPIKLVLLDEFDIDDKNFSTLLGQLCKAEGSGVIDQAILATTRRPPPGFEEATKRYCPIEISPCT